MFIKHLPRDGPSVGTLSFPQPRVGDTYPLRFLDQPHGPLIRGTSPQSAHGGAWIGTQEKNVAPAAEREEEEACPEMWVKDAPCVHVGCWGSPDQTLRGVLVPPVQLWREPRRVKLQAGSSHCSTR